MTSRKIITVDETFLSGLNKRTLSTAIAQDGRKHTVLSAHAIIESENLDSWSYFLSHLKTHFNFNHTEKIIILNGTDVLNQQLTI
jgi:hypothetical protein